MQISASNLLIASQQTQASAQPPKPAAAFAAALKADPGDAKPGFEPLPLKKAAAPVATSGLAEDGKPAIPAQASRPGANLDIRI